MIRNALARLMYGRYGKDQLNVCLFLLYLILYVLFLFTSIQPLFWAAWIAFILFLFRTLSKDFNRRRAENIRFLRLIGPLASWLRLRRTIRRDKDHLYFRCPNCKQQLRVPRGKGNITVTCRNCGAVFQEKS